ncbi:ATP-binding protein [Roseateles sp. PN1]|uniref:ATP-binding protein n=1 Tax=Roseateles sp. PN1 TaxID=3137372 RepID=UPI003139A650
MQAPPPDPSSTPKLEAGGAKAWRRRQQTLRDFELRLEDRVKRSASVFLLLVVLGVLAFLASKLMLTELSWAARLQRMAAGLLYLGAALVSLGLLHRVSVRAGTLFFCWSALVLQLGAAAYYGTGLYSSGMATLVALLAVVGLLVGPGAAVRGTVLTVLGILGLWFMQEQDLLGKVEPNTFPPLASFAVVLVMCALVVGWLALRHGTLFREVMLSLDSSRQLLADTLRAQQTAVEELRASDDRMRVLLDHSLSCTLILDGDSGQLRFANAQTLLKHGCERISELDASLFFPGDPFSREQGLTHMREVLSHGAQYFEWQTRHRDGTPIWWDIKLERLHVCGETIVVAFAHDITERLRAENELRVQRARLEEQVNERTHELISEKQRLQDIIEALPITLSIRDCQGRYTLLNRSFELATGHGREQVLGLSARHFMPAEIAAEIADTDAQLIAGKASMTTERQIMHPVDGMHDYLVTTVPLLDARKRTYALLNLGTDVTSLKRLQRELSLAKDEAEHLARVKSEFLANMSHEIRTPLNAVLGLAQLGVGRAGDPAAARSGFERITRSGRHLLSVINDILDYSKVESGKLEIDPLPCNLSHLAREVLDLVAERAEAKHLRLRLDYEVAEDWVAIDALRVTQILVNLLANAIKFTDKGRVTLGVTQAADGLRLSVTDTGVGIAPEQQARIFKAFEQADSSVTRQFGGTGLGLSISSRLAEAMGGEITVSSEVGKGSCFTLRLPCVVVSGEAHEQPLINAAVPPDLLRGLRILIVDDVDINREILQDLLCLAGAEVMSADSGEQALARLGEAGPEGYDLVLMDVQMPEMDGYETTRRLHQMAPRLRVIALTAHALPEERRKCVAAGMLGHVTKPIDQAELMQALLEHSHDLPRRAADATSPSQLVPLDAASAVQPRPPVMAPASVSTEAQDSGAPTASTAPTELAARASFWPDLPGCDFEAALTRCAGRQELLAKLLGTFAKQYAQYQSVFEEARISGMPALASAAHRLKGLSGNLGLSRLAQSAEILETAAGGRGDPAQVPAALTALIREIAPLVSSIAAWHEAYTARARV